jgi:uncharacterized membrane protein
MENKVYLLLKGLFASIGGALGYIAPSFPFVLVCLLAIAIDCYSAYSLSRRVRKKHPNANDGKFKSRYANRIFDTMLKISVLIVLAFLIDRIIIPFEGGWYLPNIVAGMFCFGQFWSVLENESSENNAKWARILQRILVNKAERHFDIHLRDILSGKEDIQRTK